MKARNYSWCVKVLVNLRCLKHLYGMKESEKWNKRPRMDSNTKNVYAWDISGGWYLMHSYYESSRDGNTVCISKLSVHKNSKAYYILSMFMLTLCTFQSNIFCSDELLTFNLFNWFTFIQWKRWRKNAHAQFIAGSFAQFIRSTCK